MSLVAQQETIYSKEINSTNMADLVIKDWQNGVSTSPLKGFSEIVNLNVRSQDGFVEMANKVVNVGNISTLYAIRKMTADNSLNVWGVNSTSVVYRISGTTPTEITGNTAGTPYGMIYYNDYIYVARSTALDRYGPLSGAAAWANSWQALQSALYHPMLVTQENVLHIGNGRYVATVNSSDTFNGTALDLSPAYVITALEELGTDLMIGTISGTAGNIGVRADIFPWDRVSASYKFPIRLGVSGIQALKTLQNTLYIVAGDAIYVTNGSSAQKLVDTATLFRALPTTSGSLPILTTVDFQAIASYRNRLLIGFSWFSGGNWDGAVSFGIWAYENGRWYLDRLTSNGGTDFIQNAAIGAIVPISDATYYFSWSYGAPASHGVDRARQDVLTDVFHSNYEPFFATAFYKIGTILNPRSIQQIELTLGKKLVTGQGIRLKYRTSLADDWTTIGTYDFATYGGVSKLDIPFIVSTDSIQFRVEFTTNGTGIVSPQLQEIRVTFK